MKNLIIAIILIFAGLNEVQSQTRVMNVRQLSLNGENLYHAYSRALNPNDIFRYTNTYEVTYLYELSFTNHRDHVSFIHNGVTYRLPSSDADFARHLQSRFDGALEGNGYVVNESRVGVPNIVRSEPFYYVQLIASRSVRDRWEYNSHADILDKTVNGVAYQLLYFPDSGRDSRLFHLSAGSDYNYLMSGGAVFETFHTQEEVRLYVINNL